MAGSRLRQRQPQPRGNSFFGGAAILAVGIAVVKIIGMFYKVPLYNIIGEQGVTDFTNAYNIYSVLLTASTAGLPVAMSKIVSEGLTQGRQNQVRKVFRVALFTFFCIGLAGFAVMFFFADPLAAAQGDPLAAPSIRCLAPAVFFVSLLAVFRGYAQGHSDMIPTAVSQIIEALSKLVIGLALAGLLIQSTVTAEQLLHYRPELDQAALTAGELAEALDSLRSALAASGAIVGVTIGTALAVAYVLVRQLRRSRMEPRLSHDRPDSSRRILGDLLKVAVPITLSSSIVGLVSLVDAAMVQHQLQNALGLTLDESRSLYGCYGTAQTIYNLPSALMVSITASVIPAITACRTRRDRVGANKLVGSSLRVSALLCFPMGAGLVVLGTPIIRLLFKSNANPEMTGVLLSTLGLASVFVCIVLVCNSILQAHGFVNLPVATMLVGGVVKVITNYNLVALPQVGIYGAPMGNVLCFGLVAALDLFIIARVSPGRPAYRALFLKPLIASVLMGGAAWAVYGLASRVLLGVKAFQAVNELGETALSWTGNAGAVLAAILAAVVVYAVLVVVLRILTKDDLALMPKGEKLGRILGIR